MAWYTKNSQIDIHSLELMFLHIKKCRKFKNTSINLNAKYNFKFELKTKKQNFDSIIIENNEEHIDLFKNHGINLKVICGENGVGKTTIIDLLQGKIRESDIQYVLIFKDNKNNFLSTEKIYLTYQGEKYDLMHYSHRLSDYGQRLSCSNNAKTDATLSIYRLIALFYRNHHDLFDLNDGLLFNRLQIDFWLFNDYSDSILDNLKDKFNLKILTHKFKEFCLRYPLIYLFLEFSQDNTFDDFYSKLIQKKVIKKIDDFIELFIHIKNFSSLNKQIQDFIIESYKEDIEIYDKEEDFYKNITKKIKSDHIYQEFDFTKFNIFDQISQKFTELSNEIDSFWKRIFIEEELFHINPGYLEELFYFRPFKEMSNKSKRYLEDLSDGEFMDVKIKYNLLPTMLQTDGAWIYEDEPDLHLHPEMKRLFIHKYLNAIDQTREFIVDRYEHDKTIYNRKIYSIVLTTHSPFILSDLPNDNIIFLEPQDGENVIVKEDVSKTFAGNIGQMFYDNFFMKETIGEFAKKKIETILEDIKEPILESDKEIHRKVFESVGDELLKNLLLEKLDSTKVTDETH